MSRGRIIKSGDASLALELEKNGYRDYVAAEAGDATASAA